jgi:transposase
MGHIAGDDRDQMLLLPESVDDYVGADNPVRFIDAFVDGLDLGALGFARAMPKATGRPGYAPGDLLKLYIYGYLNRIRSSRRLEAECHRNVELIWLLRRLAPDFKTIADFRRDNRTAFKAVFREFVILCRDLDLFGRELLAVDGTRIKAVNIKDRNYTRRSLEGFIQQADARLDDYLKRLDESDVEDVGGQGPGGGSRTDNLDAKIAALREKRGRYLAILHDLERSGEDQISLTDPDSRAMAGHTRVGVGYNAQIFRQELADQKAQRASLMTQIEAAETRRNVCITDLSDTRIAAFAAGVKQRLRSGDPAFRRKWLQHFVSEVVVGRKEIRIRVRQESVGDCDPDEVPSFDRKWRTRQDSNL